MSDPPSAPDSSTACSTMVVSTSSGSRVELTAFPTSASASISSTLRASSAERAWSAENSSTLRRASAACSAKVVSRLVVCSSNGSTVVRHTDRTPTTSSSTSMGAPMIERYPPSRWSSGRLYSGSASTSAICCIGAVEDHAPDERVPVARNGVARGELEEARILAVRADEPVHLPVGDVDLGDLRAADAAGVVDDRLEDVVLRRRRPREDRQDLARGAPAGPGPRPAGRRARPGRPPQRHEPVWCARRVVRSRDSDHEGTAASPRYPKQCAP